MRKSIATKSVKPIKIYTFEQKLSAICGAFSALVFIIQLLIIFSLKLPFTQTKILNLGIGFLFTVSFGLVFFKPKRKKILGVIFFVLSFICALDGGTMYAIFLLALGVGFLYRFEFFRENLKRRIILLSLAVLLFGSFVCIIADPYFFIRFMTDIAFLSVVCITLFQIFRKELYLLFAKPPVYSLTQDGNLTNIQAQVVLRALEYKNNKEIALELNMNLR